MFTGLSDSKQQLIWNLEHNTFELEWKFGKSITAALQDENHEEITERFLDSFSGSIPTSPVISKKQSWWQEYRQESSASTRDTVDATEMSKYLIAYMDSFASVKSASLRVLDIKRPLPNEPRYDLKCLISMTGQTTEGKPVAIRSTHQLVCRFRNDEQIATGKIVQRWDVLSVNKTLASQQYMKEVTSDVGLDNLLLRDNWKAGWDPPQQNSMQIAVADFDRDGFLDIAISTIDECNYLLKSIAGKEFVNVTSSVGLPLLRTADGEAQATWIDFDNDGFPDLLLDGSLYRNLEGREFVDVTDESGLILGPGQLMSSAVADFDCDGWLDIYLLYQGTSNDEGNKIGWLNDEKTGASNQLWRNVNGQFENVTATAGVGDGFRNSFAATWLYVNDDHLPDLYVANDFATNQLYLNTGNSRFEDASAAAGVSDFATSMGIASADLSGDGSTDIYVANMYSKMGRRIIGQVDDDDYPKGTLDQIKGSCAGNRLYERVAGQLKFQEVSEQFGVNEVGWSYAPAIADFDNDGRLDIYAACGFMSFNRARPDG